MEIFIWLYVWDKRFFLDIRHHPLILTYIWLLPISMSLIVTLLSYEGLKNLSAVSEHRAASLIACTDETLSNSMVSYRNLQIVNLVVLVLTMFKAYLERKQHTPVPQKPVSQNSTVSGAKHSHPPGHHGSHHHNHHHHHPHHYHHQNKHVYFDYWQRHNTVYSWQGVFVLILNILIYIWSFRYLSDYRNAVCVPDRSLVQGVYYMMLHATLIAFSGSLALGIFLLAIALKLTNVLSFVFCPLKMLWLKKKLRGIK